MSEYYDYKELKAIPIADVANAFGIHIKQKGRDYECSVRTEDHTPSVRLYSATNSFCDFGNANKGGDTIAFVSYIEDCPYKEAAELLAQQFGIRPMSQNKNKNTKLTDWQYAKINIDGKVTSHNFNWDYLSNNYSFDEMLKIASKYQMPINDLKEDRKKLYANIIKNKSIPYVYELYNWYLRTISSEINLYLEIVKKDKLPPFYELPDSVKENIQEAANLFIDSQNVLKRACDKTEIKFKIRSVNIEKDIQAVRNGRLQYECGTVMYAQLKASATKTGEKLKYYEMPYEKFLKSFGIDIEKPLPQSHWL